MALKNLFGDIALEETQKESSNLLRRIADLLMSPRGFDSAQNRQRGTVVLESGTVTTVTGLTNIDSIQGRLLANGQNLTAWYSTVRSRIS